MNGNLTNDGVNTYTWNARNQLVAIDGASVTASFGYNGVGRRRTKTINATTTDFLYDGPNPVQELSGATVLANILAGLGVDEYFTRTDSGGTRALLTDALGSTLALTDPAGTVQTQYTYEAFGPTTATGPTSGNPFQYTGRENDGIGLYYYRARYYLPTLARFLSEDPMYSPLFKGPEYSPSVSRYLEIDRGTAELMILGFSGVGFRGIAGTFSLNPQLLHLYTYADNDPVDRTDPMGLIAGYQPPGCDYIPVETRCTTKCCNAHDLCYKRATIWCDMSTWKRMITGKGRPRVECEDCNWAAVRCIFNSIKPGGRKGC